MRRIRGMSRMIVESKSVSLRVGRRMAVECRRKY